MPKTYIKERMKDGKHYHALLNNQPRHRQFATATDAIKYAERLKVRYVSLKLAELRQKAEPEVETCAWENDGEGNYTTACGKIFQIIADTPEENEMVYCPFCGKPIREVVSENFNIETDESDNEHFDGVPDPVEQAELDEEDECVWEGEE